MDSSSFDIQDIDVGKSCPPDFIIYKQFTKKNKQKNQSEKETKVPRKDGDKEVMTSKNEKKYVEECQQTSMIYEEEKKKEEAPAKIINNYNYNIINTPEKSTDYERTTEKKKENYKEEIGEKKKEKEIKGSNIILNLIFGIIFFSIIGIITFACIDLHNHFYNEKIISNAGGSFQRHAAPRRLRRQ